MKAVLKQKFFLLGILFIVGAIAVGFVNSATHRKMKVVTTMEKGLQKENIRTLKGVIAPSVREKETSLDDELKIMLGLFKLEGIDLRNYHILQGNILKDAEGKITGVNTIQVYTDGDKTDISVNELDLMEENGKYYISGGLY